MQAKYLAVALGPGVSLIRGLAVEVGAGWVPVFVVVLAVVALWAIARLVVRAGALADSGLVLLVGVVARTAAVAMRAVILAEFLRTAAPASPESSSQSTAGASAVLL